MQFTIRRRQTEEDMQNFFRMNFETAKSTNDWHYRQLKQKHPNKSEEEIFHIFKDEVIDSYDLDQNDCRIFVAEDKNGTYAGHLWIAPRTQREIWDIKHNLWIYDITVSKKFRRKGLGRKLIQRGEEYARELDCDIGLLVHEDNLPAQRLYRSEGYRHRAYPLVIEPESGTIGKASDFVIRKQNPSDEERVEELSLGRFRRLVLLSTDASDKEIITRYEELQRRRFSLGSNQQRFVIETPEEAIVGFIWVGRTMHNENKAKIYDFVVDEDASQRAAEMLLSKAVDWAAKNDYSKLYFQLHSKDNIDPEMCQNMGFELLGYIMEKPIA